MQSIIDNLLSVYRNGFAVRQLLVIMMIFAIGYIMCQLLLDTPGGIKGLSSKVFKVALSFPMGIALFAFAGYIVLVCGVRYTIISVITCVILLSASLIILVCYKNKKNLAGIISFKEMIIALLLVLILGAMSVSGFIKMSVSNDSLYYFWQYPRAIVSYGGLRDQFDNFLTDTGLGAAVIGTLPFLFGFGETFGIQTFFHMSFLLFFGSAVYETITSELIVTKEEVVGGSRRKLSKELIISVLATVFMGVCTPAYILSHWAMANMYFMDYYFIALYLIYLFGKDHKPDSGKLIIFAFVVFACASVRMEGAIFILLLVLMGSTKISSSRWLAGALVPIVIMQSIYELKLYLSYVIDNPYTFMTVRKAIIQFVAYVVVMVYLVFMRDLITKKLKGNVAPWLIIGLLMINGVLLVMDRSLYIANIRAFIGNLTGQSGWGILPHISVGAFFLLIYFECILYRRNGRIKELLVNGGRIQIYWLYNMLSFVLVTIAVSFERGDPLEVVTGDSGNRVLLQVAPIVVMMFIVWFADILNQEESDS